MRTRPRWLALTNLALFVPLAVSQATPPAATGMPAAAPPTGAVEPSRERSDRPLREAQSANERYLLRITPGRAGRVGRPCEATLFEQARPDQAGRRVWERPLVNEVGPTHALVRDDGRFVVTLDEARRGGARHTLVIYNGRGELLRHFLLPDLLHKSDWPHVRVSGRDVQWLRDARLGFEAGGNEFVVQLAWGRKIRIDMRTLRLIDSEHGQPDSDWDALAPALLAQLTDHWAPPAGDEPAVAAALEAAEPQQVVAEIGDVQPGPDLAEAMPDPDVAGAIAGQPEIGPAALSPTDDAGNTLALEAIPDSAATGDAALGDAGDMQEYAAEPPAPSISEDQLDAAPPTPLSTPPPPDPASPTDYVAWFNMLGRVEGPDAAPLYDAAVAQTLPWAGTGPDPSAAANGDPDALTHPEITAWLAANAAAVEQFRAAARLPARGWTRSSEDGSLIGMLLPELPGMRTLARAAIATGRQAALVGRPGEAVGYFVDTLAAGAHVGDGATLIENLVGTAMQATAAQALLDVQAQSADLDYVSLAAQAEAAYRPPRPMAETLSAERAMFLDSMQRVWAPAEPGGEPQFDPAAFARLADIIGIQESPLAAMQMTHQSFGDTVAYANAYYDALSEATALPFPEAATRLREIESVLIQQDANPLLRSLLPSMSNVAATRTRGEALRRGTLLVTQINAYRQQTGTYPDSLEALGRPDLIVDPSTGALFSYERGPDGFSLQSAGVPKPPSGHEPQGQPAAPVQFWPRSAR